MGATVFISYATKDSNKFHIATIAERLTNYPEIDNALYWEEDMHDDIYKYMNENVGKCDVFLLFCSQTALNSEPIEMEWMAALKKKRKVIPIFTDEDDIPTLLSTRLGIQFKKNDLDGTIKSIYQLILKKLNVSPKARNSGKRTEIVDFKGAKIPQFEADILQELEDLKTHLNAQFNLVNELKYDTEFEFSVKHNQVSGISIYFCGLLTLPDTIGQLSSLIELCLWGNFLTLLPDTIGNLESLEILDLGYNRLTTLPKSIGNLTMLRSFNLENNQLTNLPESIITLPLLMRLNAEENPLDIESNVILKQLEESGVDVSK